MSISTAPRLRKVSRVRGRRSRSGGGVGAGGHEGAACGIFAIGGEGDGADDPAGVVLAGLGADAEGARQFPARALTTARSNWRDAAEIGSCIF